MQITQNCFVNGMPEDVYHNDPTPVMPDFVDSAALSSSTLKDIMEKTEIEARAGIRRLNPGKKEESSDAMDFGDMAHDFVLLGGESKFEIAPFDDWRKNDAKAVKADIIARGKIPLNLSTQSKLDDIRTMKTRLFEQIAEHRDYKDIMLKGFPEQAGFAFDGDIWNRIRIDWNDQTHENLIVDYKTTGISFEQWEKNELWKEKFYQDFHYRRVADIIRNGTQPDSRPFRFIFVVQQTSAPFLIQIFEVDKSYHELIQGRCDLGRKKFINCTKTGIWRGVPPYTAYTTPPPWIESKWEMDSLNEEWFARREKEAQDAAAGNQEQPPQSLIMAG